MLAAHPLAVPGYAMCMAATMETILVVDDEPAILELLVEILRDEGFLAVAARDGQIALQMLAGTTVDLVISDTMMPRRSGVELLRSMREQPELRDVPVILMSATIRPALNDVGAVEFLSKPFDVSTFNRVVAEALGRG